MWVHHDERPCGTKGHATRQPTGRERARVLLNQSLLGKLLVDFWAVQNVLRTGRVVEGTEGLFVVALCGRDRGNDARLGAATERVLQQSSELRLTVGNVRRSLHELVDHTPKREQALIDVASLPSAILHGPRAANVFRSSQVHKVKFTSLEQFLTILASFGREGSTLGPKSSHVPGKSAQDTHVHTMLLSF